MFKRVHHGDQGETSMIGKRVPKTDSCINAYGSVDELNSFIGLCRAVAKDKNENDLADFLEKIQEKLFVIGSELATPEGTEAKVKITIDDANDLEKKTLEYEKELPDLRHFILPGGGRLGSLLHIARSVCRRAEREVVGVMQKEKVNEAILVYLNRLSDLFFMMSRLANKREGFEEKEWKA